MGICAQELGSELGALTQLEAGVDRLLERDRGAVTDALECCRSNLRSTRARKVIRSGKSTGRSVSKQQRELAQEERRLVERLAELPALLAPDPPPSILASQRVHFGVEVMLGGVRHRPSESTGGRRFTFDQTTQSIEATKP